MSVHFSSKTDEWATPQDVFDLLNGEFGFDIDLAASSENAKCPSYLTKDDDALAQDWHLLGSVGWCNPPYSRPLGGRFIAKAAHEASMGFTTVMLIPARTDTRAFHEHIWSDAGPRDGVEVRFLKGRLKFGNATNSAPFPSMVVVFRGRRK